MIKKNLRNFLATSSACLLLSAGCQRPSVEETLVLIQVQDRNGLSETISSPDRLATYEHTDFSQPQPYKKVLRTFRKEGKNRSIISTYHPNGTPWQMLEIKEMRAFGAFVEWFPNGRKKLEATVIGGDADLTGVAQDSWIFDGLCKVWDEQGRAMAEIPYEKGALSGTALYYYPSGAIEKKRPYVRDRLEGIAEEFWETGAVKAFGAFQQGVPDGLAKGFWIDGTLRYEETYEKGSSDGSFL